MFIILIGAGLSTMHPPELARVVRVFIVLSAREFVVVHAYAFYRPLITTGFLMTWLRSFMLLLLITKILPDKGVDFIDGS